jgi:DNA-binding NarL/FixJ family response regulator
MALAMRQHKPAWKNYGDNGLAYLVDGGYVYIRMPLENILPKMRVMAEVMLPHFTFTKQEKLVVNQLIEAKSNKEIAAAMNLCVRTVKFHVSQILKKTGAENRTQVAMKLKDYKGINWPYPAPASLQEAVQ